MTTTDPPFPSHDPNFPDVNPATGDERETTEGAAVELDAHGVCVFCGEPDADWDSDSGVYLHDECDPDGDAA